MLAPPLIIGLRGRQRKALCWGWVMGTDIREVENRAGFGMAQAEPGLPAFAEMRGYWEALRRPDGLPLRADLDPRGLKNCLHQALIAERVAPGLARMRLAGATFTDVMGMEVRGMPLSALFDPMARAPLEAVLNRVFSGGELATLLLEAERGLGRPALTAQLMLLPMVGDTGEVDLMLGCLVLRGTAGRTPRRFQILHAKYETIGAAPKVAHEPVPLAELARLQPRERVADVPYLRLVK
jgi:hypothetical protein